MLRVGQFFLSPLHRLQYRRLTKWRKAIDNANAIQDLVANPKASAIPGPNGDRAVEGPWSYQALEFYG